MFGLNPVATGILLGGIGGPMGMAIGGGIGAMYDSAQGAKRDAQREMRRLEGEGVKNQNRLVQENYNKRKSALGIGEAVKDSTTPSGNASSQTGTILTSTTGGNSILG